MRSRNNGPLAELDQCLADFMPLKLRRTTLGLPNKLRSVPATVFQDARLELVEGRPALTGPAPRSWQLEQVDPRDPRWSVGTATLTGGRPLKGPHAAQISRASLQVGFEAAWTDLGERLMEENFDELRTLILGQRRRTRLRPHGEPPRRGDAGHYIHYDAIADTETGRAGFLRRGEDARRLHGYRLVQVGTPLVSPQVRRARPQYRSNRRFEPRSLRARLQRVNANSDGGSHFLPDL